MLFLLRERNREEDVLLGQEFGRYFREGLEIFGGVSVLLGLYFLGAGFGMIPKTYEKECMMVLFLGLSYGGCRYFRRDKTIFLALFTFCFSIVSQIAPCSFLKAFQTAGGLAGSLILFRILMAGLQRRLLFSPVPRSFAGGPVLLITAALLAMIFTGFQGVFFP